ncbi:nuclear transport factor 2 family protein [Mycolicibacterium sp. 018/SC-01/001]|uniref:nuclear transport factor 2 family protein n=1 Tax=Mycolicibacterium sp. 018/SC-01/001 TaxID=2592069 RepID=UPI0011809564|nr:nuclear transport factor 2 family protein [Mycolicibacterium sp. 018/SC-01/001]TRW86161.1 nuclear transport factor 2 family protein [Mycolicibacterium sp. 018/SC-01/001]
MSDDIVRLMEENLLAVFNERDADARLAVVRRNYAPDVRWSDAEETVTGQDRLHEKAQALLDGPLAGLDFTPAGPVHQVANMGYLNFEVYAPGATDVLIAGFDVAIVENGVIAQLFTVVTQEPPATP